MADTSVDEQVSDAEIEDGEEEQPRRRFSGKKILLFIGLPLVLIGGATQTGLLGDMFGGEKPAEGEVVEEVEPPKEAIYFDLPDMLVNLNTGGGKPRYLKLSVSLEVYDDATVSELERVLPRVIDRFQVYLRELRAEDISGSAGVYRLKEELLARVTSAVEEHEVNDVLFREMLVQ